MTDNLFFYPMPKAIQEREIEYLLVTKVEGKRSMGQVAQLAIRHNLPASQEMVLIKKERGIAAITIRVIV